MKYRGKRPVLSMVFGIAAILGLVGLGAIGVPCSGAAQRHIYPGESIQAAIDAAESGDEIIVHEGVYEERIVFGDNAVTVRSTNPEDPAVVAATVIDGGRAGNVVVFKAHDQDGSDSMLSGVTIRNGQASCGAGIYCRGASPTITHCVISSNISVKPGGCGGMEDGSGGGIFCNISSSPIILNCTISGNLAEGSGGGIVCFGSSPVIENCIIRANQANGLGGGGGVYCENSRRTIMADSRPTITGCIILANSPDDLMMHSGAPVITSSEIWQYSSLSEGEDEGAGTLSPTQPSAPGDQGSGNLPRLSAESTLTDIGGGNESGGKGTETSGIAAAPVSFSQKAAAQTQPKCSGDLTADGQITPADVLLAFRCYLGLASCPDCTDVNRDYQVTPADALCLLQAYLGQSSCLSGGESSADIDSDRADSYVAIFPQLFYSGEQGAISLALFGQDQRLVRSRVQATLSSNEGKTVVDTGELIDGKGKIEFTVPPQIEQGEYQLTVEGEGFTGKAAVRVEESLLIFAETDKPIYKPGQTIHLRVMTLDAELRPVSRRAVVEILDAKGIKIFRKEANTDEYGLATLDLPLSTEPNLGVWKITASASQRSAQLDVRVEKYVLPKYEVSPQLSKEWFLIAEPIRGKVKAEYSFGKPVKGDLVIEASRYVGNWEMYATFTRQIEGEVEFEIPPAEYAVGVPATGGMANVTLNISVKEKSTGYEEKVTKLLTVCPMPLNITIIPESSVFKPSLPFTTLITTETPDHQPKDTKVNVTVTYLDTEFAQTKEEEKPLETRGGKVLLTITPPAQTIAVTILVNAENGYATRDIQAGYSPSGSFIHLEQLSQGSPGVGETIRFKVHSTAKPTNFYYEVMARNRVVFTDFTQTSEIPLTVTPLMAPSAKILVYQILPNSEVAADYLPFTVTADYPQNVTATFSQEEVRPGEEVEISVETEGKSRVGLAAVDKSVFILAENRLNLQQVFDELERLYMQPQAELHYFSASSSQIGTKGTEDIFKDVGVIVLSNKTIPKGKDYQKAVTPWWGGWIFLGGFGGGLSGGYSGGGGGGGGGFAMSYGGGLYGEGFASGPDGGGLYGGLYGVSPEGLAQVERVRQFFPETWLWQDVITDNQGHASLTAQAPDSITTWMFHTVALSPDQGLGFSDASLRVFQPFFITVDLPYSAIRGEEFPVRVSVYNYLNEKQNVLVEIEPKEWFELLDKTHKEIGIEANDLGGAQFTIRPKQLGTREIKITARSSAAADAVIKTIIIDPEGVAREVVENAILSAGTSKVFKTAIADRVVEGSGRAYLCATSNYLAQTMDGLDSLLQMPCGCGEQNMILLAPDVYITQYLKQSGQIKPQIMAKAEKLMITGYQRELTYQHGDGSFSAFGQSDQDGSLWLTAFVLKVFSEARELIYIDESVLAQARDWIVKHQNSDGSFDPLGFICHKDMMGGLQGKSALTAFIAIVLLRAGETESAARAISCLETRFSDQAGEMPGDRSGEITGEMNADAYTLAMTAYAFELAGSKLKAAACTRLMSLATEDEQGISWGTGSAQIEATGYALLALVEQGDRINAGRAARWLVSRRNARGGFSTTQDTVVALNALTAYSRDIQADVDLTIEIETQSGSGETAADGTLKEIKITDENFDVLQVIDVPVNGEITLTARGTGDAIIQTVRRYNLPQPPKQDREAETFRISVDYGTAQVQVNDLITVSVEVGFAPHLISTPILLTDNPAEAETRALVEDSQIVPPIRPPVDAGMVVLDIAIPTGFAAVTESLDELVKNEPAIKRYDIAGRKVILFIENMLAGEKLALSFCARALYPVKAKAVSSQAYSYYQPNMKGETLSRDITVLEH